MTYANVPGDARCECADSNCPACHGECFHKATCVLFRVDMDDTTGTAFCDDCADDAGGSGLFTTADDDDDTEDSTAWRPIPGIGGQEWGE